MVNMHRIDAVYPRWTKTETLAEEKTSEEKQKVGTDYRRRKLKKKEKKCDTNMSGHAPSDIYIYILSALFFLRTTFFAR